MGSAYDCSDYEDDLARDAECMSCGEVMPTKECSKSHRSCGHHCNHSWDQDICHWCGQTWDDLESVAAAGSATPDQEDDDG